MASAFHYSVYRLSFGKFVLSGLRHGVGFAFMLEKSEFEDSILSERVARVLQRRDLVSWLYQLFGAISRKQLSMSKLYETVTIISGELSELIRLACQGVFRKHPQHNDWKKAARIYLTVSP